MEVVLRQVGYTLEEINTMSEKLILYRFLIGQKILTGGSEGTSGTSMPPVPQPPPVPSSPARGMRRSPSGTSYNFPR